jgi:transposase InsO family protein
LKLKRGGPARRYPDTAIDGATRVRALKVYRRHTQANAIDFIHYVAGKFPFRICTIQTDRGHEFQELFHWHVANLGMERVYIKPGTPQLGGKVERSHRTGKEEFYRLLSDPDGVDLGKKLVAWEGFYDYDQPYGPLGGKPHTEVLGEKLR